MNFSLEIHAFTGKGGNRTVGNDLQVKCAWVCVRACVLCVPDTGW